MWEGEEGEKCLCSSSLVLAWGQRCHCDSRVSQSRLGKQEHKQITGAQRECARKKERRKMGDGMSEEASSQDESRLLILSAASSKHWGE